MNNRGSMVIGLKVDIQNLWHIYSADLPCASDRAGMLIISRTYHCVFISSDDKMVISVNKNRRLYKT